MNNNNQNIHIRLQDGNSLLSTWESRSAAIPTIGETIRITAEAGLGGRYQPEAVVTRIDEDLRTGRVEIIAEASPAAGTANRGTVVLNSAFVPAGLRGEVESIVRKSVRTPSFDWRESQEPTPLIEVHGGGQSLTPAELNRLRNEIRAALQQRSELTYV